jgi:flagellar basal-body rod modification protein FlgD
MQVEAAKSGSGTGMSNPVQQKKDIGKEAFLQLLVAQVKNQNPMNPTDGVQFLSQLAQFTQVEQLIGIREDLASFAQQKNDNTSGDNR